MMMLQYECISGKMLVVFQGGVFTYEEGYVLVVECLTYLLSLLLVMDSWAGSLLSGWLHTAELYPPPGRFRCPCESLVSRL
jgi:hypothetical protein